MSNTKEFLNIFFGPKNLISLQEITSPNGKSNSLKPWLVRFVQKRETVLPVRLSNGSILWYGIAFNNEQYNRLGEDLGNFIGRTYSTFFPVRPKPVAHPIEEALIRFLDGRFYRFQGSNKEIYQQLEYLRNMWDVRPQVDKQQITSIGRLLRDYYMMLRLGLGYRQKAEQLLEEMQKRQLINAANILFLKIQMLAEYKCWEEILSQGNLSDLIQMRKPLAVSEALYQAIYNSMLKEKEESIDRLIETFEKEINPKFGSLFSSRGSLKSREVLLLLMLSAVTIKKDEGIAKDILKVPTDDVTKALLVSISDRLIKVGENPVEVQSITIVTVSVMKGKFDQALGLLKELEPSWERAMLLFQCAYQLQSLESQELALKAFQQLTVEEQDRFLEFRQNKDFLEEITDGHVIEEVIFPFDWLSWLDNLPNFSPMKNFHLADNGASEWSIERMLEPDYPMMEFKNKLIECYDDDHKKESLYYAFPHLLKFFQKDEGWPRREFHDVYYTMLELLSFHERKGEVELALFQELIEAMLQVGVTSERYDEMLDMWKYILGEMASYNTLFIAFDVIETFLAYPCHNTEKRLEVFYHFCNKVLPFARKFTRNEWSILQLLHRDLGQDEHWNAIEEQYNFNKESEEVVDFWELLAGKTIGIYSLMESALLRARDIIKSNHVNINILTNNDKAGSESLRNMVKRSDILIVATASAKHAATIFIEQQLDSSTILLRPKGKGSSSMLNEIEMHAKSLLEN